MRRAMASVPNVVVSERQDKASRSTARRVRKAPLSEAIEQALTTDSLAPDAVVASAGVPAELTASTEEAMAARNNPTLVPGGEPGSAAPLHGSSVPPSLAWVELAQASPVAGTNLVTGSDVLAGAAPASAVTSQAGSVSFFSSSILIPAGWSVAAASLVLRDTGSQPQPQPQLQSVTTKAMATRSDIVGSSANTESGKTADKVKDGQTGTAYANTDKAGAGLIFKYSEAARASSLSLTSAADQPGNDPTQVSIYGSNTDLGWSDAGWLALPAASSLALGMGLARGATTTVNFANDTAYRYYKVVFDAVRNPASATAVQVAEASLGLKSDAIVLDFDMPLSPPGAGDTSRLSALFQVNQGGQSFAPSDVRVEGDKVTLLVPQLQPAQFTLSYSDMSLDDDIVAIQSAIGVDAGSFVRGLASDGYIRGGRILLDDGDGIVEVGIDIDTGITTGTDGSFVLRAEHLDLLSSGRSLMLVDGINIDTGLPNLIAMTAPRGAKVINPLTTLAQAMIHDGAVSNLQEASEAIAEALGFQLASGANLSTLDPIAAAKIDPGNPLALAPQKAAVKVATLLSLATENAATGDRAEMHQALIKAIAKTIDEIAETNGPELDLASSAGLSTVSHAANALLGNKPGGALSLPLSTIVAKLASISSADSLDKISLAQQMTLDKQAPPTPQLKSLLPGANGLATRIMVELSDGLSTTGEARAGDVLHLHDANGAARLMHTLTEAEVQAGSVLLELPTSALDAKTFRISLVDAAGNRSGDSGFAWMANPSTPFSEIDLGGSLLTFTDLAVERLSNQPLGVFGKLGDIIPVKEVAGWLTTILGNLPSINIKSGPMSGQGGSVVLKSDSSSFDWGLPPVPSSDTSSDSNSQPGTDSGSTSGSNGGSSSDPSVVDDTFSNITPPPSEPDWDIKPIPPGIDPTPYPVAPGAYSTYTGTQNNMPEDYATASLDNSTGNFLLSFRKSWRPLDVPLGGAVGGDLAKVSIDANLGGFITVEGTLAGDVEITTSLDDILVLFTDKTNLKAYVNVGLSEGSTVEGTLGPLTLTGKDQASAYASSTSQRKNTGIEGGVTLSFNDGLDGIANDNKLSMLTAAESVYNRIAANPFAPATYTTLLTDTFRLAAFLEGRISAEVEAGFSLGKTLAAIPGVNDSEVGKIVLGIADLLTLSLITDLSVPFRVAYDSADPRAFTDQTMAQVHLDNIELALGPIISDMTGAAVEIIDTVMKPFYAIENFFRYQIPKPQPPAPLNVADPSWPTLVQDFINGLANIPAKAAHEFVTSLVNALDAPPKDGVVTIAEAIKSAAQYYRDAVAFVDDVWSILQGLGLGEALNASGYGAAINVLMGSLKIQKQVIDYFIEYYKYFELALDIIDKVENLGNTYRELKAGQSSKQDGLSIPFGSVNWDILEGVVDYSRIDIVDSVVTPGADPEPTLSTANAVARLQNAINGGTVSSLGKGSGGLGHYLYYHAGFDGVDANNIDAINSIVGASSIKTWLATPQSSQGLLVEPAFAQSTDQKIRMLGKVQQIIDAYNQLQRVANGNGTANDKSSLAAAFQVLEIVGRENVKDASFQAKHYNPRAVALLGSIVDALRPADLDTVVELQNVWNIFLAWNNLNGNRTPQNPNGTPGSTLLSAEQLNAVKLILMDPSTGASSANATLNQKIKEYSGTDFSKFYGDMRREVMLLNDNWVTSERAKSQNSSQSPDALATAALKKIADAAEANDGATKLTREDFVLSGIGELKTSAELSAFVTFLDSAAIKSAHADTAAELRSLIAAYKKIVDAADDKAVSAGEFYSAVELLFPANGQTANRAVTLEKLPFANSDGGLDRPTNRSAALPLLQSLVAKGTGADVDTFSELNKIIDVTEDVLELSLNDSRLWSATNAKLFKVWSSNSSVFDSRTKQYTTDFATPLTSEDLALVGLSGVTTAKLLESLKAYNTSFRPASSPMVTDRLASSSSLSALTEEFKNGYLFDFVPVRKTLAFEDLSPTSRSVTQGIESLIAKNDLLYKLWTALKDVGVEFPFLSSQSAIFDLITGKNVVDFIRFTPPIPAFEDLRAEVSYDLLDISPTIQGIKNIIPLSVPVGAAVDFSMVPRLTVGVDSTFLEPLVYSNLYGRTLTNPWYEYFADSIYIMDKHLQNGSMVDLPEFELDLLLSAFGRAGIGDPKGFAYFGGELSAGAGVKLSADIITNDPDGKLRLGDAIEKIISTPTGIFDVLGIKGDAFLDFKASLLAQINTQPQTGLSGLDPLAQALVKAYNLSAAVWDFPTEFKWNPELPYQLPLIGFDTAARTYSLLGTTHPFNV